MFKHNILLSIVPGGTIDKAFSNEHPLTTLATGPGNYERLDGIHLTKEKPGFLFYSNVISPIEGDVIVWDAVSRSVQARRLYDLSLHWEASYLNMDSVAIAADKGHIYLSDYNDGPLDANAFPNELVNGGKHRFTNLIKQLIVLNASTGRLIANTTISNKEHITAMHIIPGANNDVFVGSNRGLIRVYVHENEGSNVFERVCEE
jgi:outer membrane protein assembly factor BamB